MVLKSAALIALVPRWPGWRHLPRDARDTLFLLFVIAWTVWPHMAHLPWWCGAITAVMLLWRAELALANAPLPNRWAVAGVLAIAVALTLWTERTLFGKDAGVTLLVVLMALKTLELRARRDAMVVFFLGFFLVLTHFLYSQSLVTAVAMLLSVWGLLTALVLANMPVGMPSLRQAAALAARTAVLGVPIMLALFLLFPRIGPLWGLPQDGVGRTGLSGSLKLGGVAELASDDAVALRVRFHGEAPPPQAMYFRGPVLTSFDGHEWTRSRALGATARPPRWELQLRGTPLPYEITIEPSRLALLPLLELTAELPAGGDELAGLQPQLRADLQWQTERPITERLRFGATAHLGYRHGPRTPTPALREHLDLPRYVNQRTRAWAVDWRIEQRLAGADPRALVQALLGHIRSGAYVYTLDPGLYGQDAVDEFWLDRRQGFCEHFAVAFVVILRSLDVPARLVTGYQGTDPLTVDGYHIVRQSHAHAWAEYWQPGEGWVRADPTAAVAPDRILRGLSLAPRTGLVASALGSVSPELLANLRSLFEMMDNRWNQWVLNYSRGRQFELLQNLGVQSPRFEDLAYALIGMLCAASLGGVGWALWDRQRHDPWQRLQQRVQRRLAALGVPVGPHDPPRRRAERVRATLGTRGNGLAEALESLDRMRYAGPTAARPGRAWWRAFDAEAATATRR